MHASRSRRFALLVVMVALAPAARADLISLDLCPAGTTSTQLIWGATLSGDVVTNWGSSKDYQFQLQTPSGTTNFDQFVVLLSAQLRQSTSGSNTLRASLWTGPIVADPLLADALTTISVSNSTISSSGFSTKVTLGGGPFTAQTIGTTPSTFFFRVWAEGGNSNAGYQTKMASVKGEMESITMSPSAVIDGGIGIDGDGNGSLEIIDPMAEPVPEIDPAGFGQVLVLLAGVMGLVERRRPALVRSAGPSWRA
jgi:hypothetical protein